MKKFYFVFKKIFEKNNTQSSNFLFEKIKSNLSFS